MAPKLLPVGTQVEVKLRNFSAALTGPLKDQTPNFYVVKGIVQPVPEWENTPNVFCLAIPGDDLPLRIIPFHNVLSINGKKGQWKAQAGNEVHTVTGSKGDVYTVTRNGDRWTCTCKGFAFKKTCSHIKKVSDARPSHRS